MLTKLKNIKQKLEKERALLKSKETALVKIVGNFDAEVAIDNSKIIFKSIEKTHGYFEQPDVIYNNIDDIRSAINVSKCLAFNNLDSAIKDLAKVDKKLRVVNLILNLF